MHTIVTNLSTGEQRIYPGHWPSEAVIRAYIEENPQEAAGSFQETYNRLYRRLHWGRRTVGIGDYAAFTAVKEV